MDLATWFQLGETLTVLVAVVFGIAQVRQYHESQDRRGSRVAAVVSDPGLRQGASPRL